jgi:hypothetical protein
MDVTAQPGFRFLWPRWPSPRLFFGYIERRLPLVPKDLSSFSEHQID